MAEKVDVRTPLYRKVLEHLKEEISLEHYKPGQKLPSEAALVKKFNVSRITVGRALRELQNENLIERIAGSGSYVREITASPVSENMTFGLIIPNLGDTEIFEPICQGIAASPEAKGHALLWAHTNNLNSEKNLLELCRRYIERKISGVFFAPLENQLKKTDINNQIIRTFKKAKIPVVLLDRHPEEVVSKREICDLVGIDNYRAGFSAAEHLIKLGAERIGFIGHQNQVSTVKARIMGFKGALLEHGQLETDKSIVLLSAEKYFEIVRRASEYDAFVCANDRTAGRLMHELLANKIRVPDDIRIVGIDDLTFASLLSVPLTTVHQPCRAIGETALRLMLERIAHPQMPARATLLDCEIVVRKSCGADSAQN